MPTNKKYALAMGSSSERLFCAAVTLLSIKNIKPDFDWDIIFLHNSFTEKQKQLLNSILPCRFVDYNGNYSLGKLPKSMVKRFSIFTFSKFELFDYLKEYSKILWLDSDTLVKKDFTPIMEYCDYIAMGYDTDAYGKITPCSVNFKGQPKGLSLEGGCYNGGMVIFSDKILELNPNIKEWVYNKIIELADKISFADQSILNILPQSFGIKMSVFPSKYNARPLTSKIADKDIIIMHSYGAEKFWNNAIMQMRYPEWFKYYNIWLAMGGQPSKEVIKCNTKLLAKFFPNARKNPFKILPNIFAFIKFIIRYKRKKPKVYVQY